MNNEEKWLDTAIICGLLDAQLEEIQRLEGIKTKKESLGLDVESEQKKITVLKLPGMPERCHGADKLKAGSALRLARYVENGRNLQGFGEETIRWIVNLFEEQKVAMPEFKFPALSDRLRALRGERISYDPKRQVKTFYNAIMDLMREERWITPEMESKLKEDRKIGIDIKIMIHNYFRENIWQMSKSTWNEHFRKKIPDDMEILCYCDDLHATWNEAAAIFALAGRSLYNPHHIVKKTDEKRTDNWNPIEAMERLTKYDGTDRRLPKDRLFKR